MKLGLGKKNNRRTELRTNVFFPLGQTAVEKFALLNLVLAPFNFTLQLQAGQDL